MKFIIAFLLMPISYTYGQKDSTVKTVFFTDIQSTNYIVQDASTSGVEALPITSSQITSDLNIQPSVVDHINSKNLTSGKFTKLKKQIFPDYYLDSLKDGSYLYFALSSPKEEMMYLQVLRKTSTEVLIFPVAIKENRTVLDLTKDDFFYKILTNLTGTGFRKLRDSRNYSNEFWQNIQLSCRASQKLEILSLECILDNILKSTEKDSILEKLNRNN